MTAKPGDAPPIRATYRLQFHREFTFRDATCLVPYLADLGVSHVYASPITEARPGSTHGYDIVNHNRLNPDVGSDDDFREFAAALRAHEMGLIVDFVPNHMGIGPDNAWWLDVLEWGRGIAVRALFRHQLAPDARRSRRARAAAGRRRPIRRNSRKGRDRAALRSGGRQLQRVVFRSPFSDFAALLCRDPRRRRRRARPLWRAISRPWRQAARRSGARAARPS